MPKRGARPVGIHFALELDGIVKGYFTECSGIGSEHEVTEYREGTEDGSGPIRKLPGLRKFGNITIKRGLSKDKFLWDWRQQMVDGDVVGARKEGSIVMYDRQRKEVARWDFERAWPAKINLLQPPADSNEIGIEELTIAHEYIKRVT